MADVDTSKQATSTGKNIGLTLLLLIQILPFLGVSYLFNSKLDTETQFISRQRAGFDYLDTLFTLLAHVQQHRGIVNTYLNGAGEFKTQRSQTVLHIEKAILAVENFHNRPEFKRQNNEKWIDWRKEWLLLEQQYPQMSVIDNFNAHSSLIEDLLSSIQEEAENFGLLLYIQLDNHALAESVLKIPRLMEDLGQLRGLGAGIAARGNINANEIIRLRALGQSVSVGLDELVDDITALYQQNQALQIRVSPVLSEAANNTGQFLDIVYKQIISTIALDISTRTYFNVASIALANLSHLLAVSKNELNNLLIKQLESAQHKRNLLQAGELLVFLISSVIFYIFLRYQAARQRMWYKLQHSMAALTESKKKTQAIIESAADGIITIDETGIIDSFSAAAEHMFGYSAKEVIGQNISILMPQPYSDQHDGYLNRYQETQEAHLIGNGSREVIGQHHNGTTFPVELSVSEMQRDDQYRLYIGLLHDITRRKEAEEELRASEERFSMITRGTRDGIWDWNLTTGQIYFSPRWKAMLFYDEADIDDNFLALQNLIHPEDLGLALEGWLACMEGKTDHFVIEYRLKNKQESYTWIRCRGLAIYDNNGQPTRMAGSHSDISNQKQASIVMEHMNNELLAKAEALESSNQELDQFAYIASHDLKAPLRAIANLSQWVEEDLEEVMTDDTRKQMTLLRSRVQRMESLINGVLQYSRVGRIDIKIEEVDIAQLINEVLDGLAPPLGFQIEIAPNMPILQTARVPLSQVFGNLLSNAIKYHHQPESAKIMVTAQQSDADVYQFSVSDDGPGIAPEYHEKVFQIFQTLNARDKVESTGVGLTVVKKIVEQMGGEISLHSSEGKGSTFSFTLPKYNNEDTTVSEQSSSTGT